MKKTRIAAGIVIALGVIWTGGAWYTGTLLESQMAGMVAQANAQIQRVAPESGITLTYQNYRRGLFSSQLDLVVEPTAGAKDAWLKAGQRIVMAEHVDHGPFPLASLKSFNLLPAMATVETALVKNEVTQHLFEMAKDQSPFDLTTRISYRGDTRSEMALKPLNYANDAEKVAFGGGTFTLDADRDGGTFALTGDAQSGQLDTVNEYGQPLRLTFSGLKTQGANHLTPFKEYIGNQTLSLEKVSIAVAGKELAVADGMTLKGNSDLTPDGKAINTQIDYTVDSLKLQSQEMGSGKLTLKIGQIDGQAWHQFSQQYNARASALLNQSDVTQNPELYQQKLSEAFFGALPILLKGGPILTVAPLSWKNSKGESTYNLSLHLKDPAQATPAQTLSQEVEQTVNSLDSKLAIPVDMATEFMTQIAHLEGYQQDEAVKLATQQVNGLAAMGQMFRITTLENNTISSNLAYSNGQVTLNGQPMSLEDFLGMFGLNDASAPAAPTVPAVPAIPAAPQP